MNEKKAQVIAGDGKPISRGEVVYGISDGRPWRVGKIRPNSKYQVVAAGTNKALRAEWLSHEEPGDMR